MWNFLKLRWFKRKDHRETLCLYRFACELAKWKSRPRGPQYYAEWERQLDFHTNNVDKLSVRLINVDQAYAFIKHINGVE